MSDVPASQNKGVLLADSDELHPYCFVVVREDRVLRWYRSEKARERSEQPVGELSLVGDTMALSHLSEAELRLTWRVPARARTSRKRRRTYRFQVLPRDAPEPGDALRVHRKFAMAVDECGGDAEAGLAGALVGGKARRLEPVESGTRGQPELKGDVLVSCGILAGGWRLQHVKFKASGTVEWGSAQSSQPRHVLRTSGKGMREDGQTRNQLRLDGYPEPTRARRWRARPTFVRLQLSCEADVENVRRFFAQHMPFLPPRGVDRTDVMRYAPYSRRVPHATPRKPQLRRLSLLRARPTLL